MTSFPGYIKRSKLEIEAAMVGAVLYYRRPMGVTELMYKANMSYMQMRVYLSGIISHGLLKYSDTSGNKVEITKEGIDFYITFKQSEIMLKSKSI